MHISTEPYWISNEAYLSLKNSFRIMQLNQISQIKWSCAIQNW